MINVENVLSWFSDETRRRMDKEDITQKELAHYCRVNTGVMHNYLQGKSFPKLWNLVLIADLLGTTVNELLDFDEADSDSLVGIDPISLFEDEYEFSMHVHNRVARKIIDSKTDLRTLSEKTGFTRSTITRWFGLDYKDPELPRTSDFIVFCDALDCTPSDLLGY